MFSSFRLNPLTIARLIRRDDKSAELILTSFAKGRSFRRAEVKQAVEPILFDALLGWLEGTGPATLSDLTRDRALGLWDCGVLLTEEEAKSMPPCIGPEIGDGYRMAALLCPEVADLLKHGPNIPTPPAIPDTGFAACGYSNLPPLLGPADIAALRTYYRTLKNRGWLGVTTGRTRRLGIHNDPVARHIQNALVQFFAAFVGQGIKPSYTYSSDYFNESALPVHTDRSPCNFTFSLYLEYTPCPENDICPWPLVVHTPEGEVAAYQNRGGGVLLLGRALPHSRPPLPPGHRCQLLFMHYVPRSYSGPLV